MIAQQVCARTASCNSKASPMCLLPVWNRNNSKHQHHSTYNLQEWRDSLMPFISLITCFCIQVLQSVFYFPLRHKDQQQEKITLGLDFLPLTSILQWWQCRVKVSVTVILACATFNRSSLVWNRSVLKQAIQTDSQSLPVL